MTESLASRFATEGYVVPLRALTEDAAADILSILDLHEATHGPLTSAQRNNPHLLFRALDQLIRSDAILDPVSQILGDDLLVWGTTLFSKAARDSAYVSWHQDSTYWGLDPAEVLTAWVALSDSHSDNGAVAIVPGSHKLEQLAHRDTFESGNMLSRGQEIAVEVKPESAITLELDPGEMSLHHVRMIHGSGPNTSDRRRVGFAIRYLPAHVRQLSTVRDTATLVRGVDKFKHFDSEQAPKSDFDDEAVAFHRHVTELQQKIIMG